MLSVSTKTGDAGETSLADGSRLPKDDLVFEVIGTIDELNSHLGAVVTSLKQLANAKLASQTTFLETTQHEMFNLGGQVAGAKVAISPKYLTAMEKNSNDLQQKMEKNWHTQFVMPGGHQVAAKLDISRAVCRRLERRIVTLSKKRTISKDILRTANRLSDYLYVLRCFVNQTLGEKEKYFTR